MTKGALPRALVTVAEPLILVHGSRVSRVSQRPISRYLQVIGTARFRSGDGLFAAVVWGPLVTLRESDASPCEELRLQTEAILVAVVSKQRQN